MLQAEPPVRPTQIIVRPDSSDATRRLAAQLAPGARALTEVDVSLSHRPDLLVECAGHSAVGAHVVPALNAGVPCIVASIGALSDTDSFDRLEDAAA